MARRRIPAQGRRLDQPALRIHVDRSGQGAAADDRQDHGACRYQHQRRAVRRDIHVERDRSSEIRHIVGWVLVRKWRDDRPVRVLRVTGHQPVELVEDIPVRGGRPRYLLDRPGARRRRDNAFRHGSPVYRTRHRRRH